MDLLIENRESIVFTERAHKWNLKGTTELSEIMVKNLIAVAWAEFICTYLELNNINYVQKYDITLLRPFLRHFSTCLCINYNCYNLWSPKTTSNA